MSDDSTNVVLACQMLIGLDKSVRMEVLFELFLRLKKLMEEDTSIGQSYSNIHGLWHFSRHDNGRFTNFIVNTPCGNFVIVFVYNPSAKGIALGVGEGIIEFEVVDMRWLSNIGEYTGFQFKDKNYKWVSIWPEIILSPIKTIRENYFYD